MKRTAIAVFLGLLHAASPNYDKDVESVDTIIKALYEVISGEKGEERDWDRFLFCCWYQATDCKNYSLQKQQLHQCFEKSLKMP